MNIMISKNINKITIFDRGEKLIINNTEELYSQLFPLSNDDILTWYKGR